VRDYKGMRSLRVSLAAALLAAVVAVPALLAQPFDRLRVAPSTIEGQAPAKKQPDVIYVPTPQPVVDAMLELAQVKRSDVVYDLGSGDGRIVITAAKTYGASGVGFEIDPALVKKARENAAKAGVSSRVRFVTQDLFTADLSRASVVTLYLLQSINERLRPKLVRQLKPGTRIVSHVFNMGPEWPPEKTMTVDRSRIFLWSIAGR
jgi:SAM-dependent methyltransferase